MSPVPIPRTTLACVDCQFPRLALRALRICLSQCEYPAVKLFTDDTTVASLDARVQVVPIERIASSQAYSRFMLKELLRHIDTDFVQVVQWDGYVVRGNAWTDDFLAYDYIGARWWFREPGDDVGNGGFSLRSRRLLQALQDERIAPMDPEDEAICRHYRPLLESEHGIRIAPGTLADRYAFEGAQPSGAEFGFHRVFNLAYFHGEAELARVMRSIPDDGFCHRAFITLVEKLAALGREREALEYAARIRACERYPQLSDKSRAIIEQLTTRHAS